jgi:uncharacterized protein CbrC (UPF0167 family)
MQTKITVCRALLSALGRRNATRAIRFGPARHRRVAYHGFDLVEDDEAERLHSWGTPHGSSSSGFAASFAEDFCAKLSK